MATREAELRITPVVDPRGRRELRQLGRAGERAGDDMGRSFRGAQRAGHRLERTYHGIGRAASRAASMSRGVVSSLLSVQGLATGLVAGMAGRTVFDSLIGSNATLESQRVTFNTMIGDVEKAEDAMNRIRSYAASTPFAKGDLIEGSKRLLRLTGDNVDQNEKLLKLASQMAAINPDKTITDAAEAILDAEGLEFERLKEFGLKLKKSDIKKMKKRGETLGQAALRGVEDGLTRQTGGRDVVGALSKTFSGKMSTLKDNIGETLRVAGEPAFEVLKEGLDDVAKDFEKLKADPQFKKDLKELAGFTSEMARASVKLVRALPGAIRDAKQLARQVADFVKDNKTALMVGGSAVAAHKLTGGATTRGALALGRRALFGKRRGRGRGTALAGAASGAMPVYVVNMGKGMAGGLASDAADAAGDAAESFLQRNAGKAATAGGSGLLKSLATKGVVGTFGAGGTLAGGAILATTAGAVLTFKHAVEKTSSTMEGFDKRAKEATKRREQLEMRRLRQRGDDLKDSFAEMFSTDSAVAEVLEGVDWTAMLSRRGNARAQSQLRGSLSTLAQTLPQSRLDALQQQLNTGALGKQGLGVRLRAGTAAQVFGRDARGRQVAGQISGRTAQLTDDERALQLAAVGANARAAISQLMGDINVSVNGNADSQTAEDIAARTYAEFESKLKIAGGLASVLMPGG